MELEEMTPDRMKSIRHNAGMSCGDMAMLLNFDDPDRNGASRVREFERGKRVPSGPIARLYELLERGELPAYLFPE